MASGFTQRWKGKVAAAALWLGGSPQYGSAAYLAYSTAAGQPETLGNERVSLVTASSAAIVRTLPVAPGAGLPKDLILDVSSALFIKAPAGGGFNGSTLSVMKSTYDMRVSLTAMSSVQYAINSAYPDTTAGGAPVGGLTLSTST